MGDFATFEIHASALLRGSKILVNGEDVSERVAGYRLEATDDGVTTLTLALTAASGPLVGDGVVQVVADGMDKREAVLEFLARLDGAELERQALDGLGFGDVSTGEAFLSVLKAMVDAVS